jgi:hypothetical protein
MLTVAVVLFVSVTVWALLLPMVTLPKLSLPGLAPSWADVIPVPVSESVAVALEALLVIVTVPLNAPAAFGLKTKVTGVLAPDATATGRLGALKEKYWLEMDALLTVMLAVPVFDTVAVSVLLVPAVTLPKSRLAELRDNVPDCTGGVVAALLELKPWQPTIVARQSRTIARLLARLCCVAGVVSKVLIIISNHQSDSQGFPYRSYTC